MVLTKDELINSLKDEVRLLLHLVSKAGPQQLDYRPSPKQRSTLELLQYLTIVGPIHLNVVVSGAFDMVQGADLWRREDAIAKARSFDETVRAIEGLPKTFADGIGAISDDELRQPISLFGQTASRGQWLVRMLLSHYTAYRMQLFLWLKASGREELNTMNLWAGIDAPMTPPS